MVISPFWGSLWSLILCFLGQDYASASLRLRIVSSTWKKNRYILHSLNSALGCWENPVLRKPYRSQLKPMHWNNDLYFVSTLSVYDNINIMLYFAVSWKFKDQISQNWHSISKCKMLESKQARFHCTDLSKEQPPLWLLKAKELTKLQACRGKSKEYSSKLIYCCYLLQHGFFLDSLYLCLWLSWHHKQKSSKAMIRRSPDCTNHMSAEEFICLK